MRKTSFGDGYKPTPVDRFGIWLSARQIKRWTGSLAGKHLADVGSGYNATFIRSVLDEIGHATLVDLSIAPDLKASPKVTAVEGRLPESLDRVADASIDVTMCVSVLEHLWDPERALQGLKRITKPGGIVLLNVPSWRGKYFLELSAFRFGFSPASEMNDHKAYYDPKDLWPMLVRGGFVPEDVRVFTHKFGLNTFAVCKVARTGE
jgi:SAM-dependent methyltransferase